MLYIIVVYLNSTAIIASNVTMMDNVRASIAPSMADRV